MTDRQRSVARAPSLRGSGGMPTEPAYHVRRERAGNVPLVDLRAITPLIARSRRYSACLSRQGPMRAGQWGMPSGSADPEPNPGSPALAFSHRENGRL